MGWFAAREVQDAVDVKIEAHLSTIDGTTRFADKTYEEGVEETLAWLLGERDESPLED